MHFPGFSQRRGSAAYLLQEAFDVIHRKRPGIALVADESLQQCHRCARAVGGRVIDRSGDRHNVLEMHDLGQETADLELGVDSWMHVPVRLEQQPLSEGDDGVAASLARHVYRKLGPALTGQLAEGGSAAEAQAPAHTAKLDSLADGTDQLPAECV